MKKIYIIITAIILTAAVVFTAACTKAPANDPGNAKVTLDPNIKPDPITDIGTGTQRERGYSWSFVRVGYTYGDESKMGEYVIIKDAKSFAQYVLPNLPEADRGEAETKYTDEFFETRYIVRFFLVCSSDSIQPKVADVRVNDGKIEIVTEAKLNGVGTTDMAEHMGIVTLDKNVFAEGMEIVINGMTPSSGSSKVK